MMAILILNVYHFIGFLQHGIIALVRQASAQYIPLYFLKLLNITWRRSKSAFLEQGRRGFITGDRSVLTGGSSYKQVRLQDNFAHENTVKCNEWQIEDTVQDSEGSLFHCHFSCLKWDIPLWRSNVSVRKPRKQQGICNVHINLLTYFHGGGARLRSWLRHYVTNRNVAGSIPDGVTGICHWHNRFGRTMALRSTQPLTEMSTRNLSWGVKVLPPSCADCLQIWEPQPPGPV
jgi:hypothetical protein